MPEVLQDIGGGALIGATVGAVAGALKTLMTREYGKATDEPAG